MKTVKREDRISAKQINAEKRLEIGGTAVTSTAAELNALDGITATVTQLNRTAVTTAGTVEASKVLVVGANKNLDTLVVADNGFKLGSGAGTAVTATAAQLNRAAVTTAGVTEASKALVVGANKELDALTLTDGGLSLGPAAGTAVTAKAAELNILDGQAASATITVGAEAANVVPVQIQLVDGSGADIAARAVILAYLTSDANGDTLNATAGVTVSASTDGTALTIVQDKLSMVISEADGDIDLNVEHTDTASVYLQLVMPSGRKVASAAMTWAG